MTLTLEWDNPTPQPVCGYKAFYRQKGGIAYSYIETSGATSATTSLVLSTGAVGCYEGYVQSNCCSDNFSEHDPWGVNMYSPLAVAIAVQASPLSYIATITSTYANPYDTIITGTFTSSLAGVLAYTATYPAGSTTAAVVVSGTPLSANAETISNVTISAISPVFNNGGSLQQYDAVNTPDYFEFTATSGQTSGTTFWNGDPMVLPSFTLDSFNVTEVDGSDVVQQGVIQLSWAQSILYGSGVHPYNIINAEVKDPGGVSMGEAIWVIDRVGLRNMQITINKTSGYTISTVLNMSLVLTWADDSALGTASFYLPDY